MDKVMRETETLIVGAGQAALSLSRYLTQARRRHVVLERGRVGEAWLSRWDSLRLLTPNWLNQLHGAPAHADVDGYLGARELVDYMRRYARSFRAPVHEQTSVVSVARADGGFRVDTDRGAWRAANVVVATGHAAEPRVPAVSCDVPSPLLQLHSSRYRNAAALPPGGVLVVGGGPSGQQIAAELRRAGRGVVLAVGEHARTLRRYRGRDILSWLYELGDLRRPVDDAAGEAVKRAPNLTLSGANGGEQLDLAVLAGLGVTVAGRLVGFDGSTASFADDLEETTARAEIGLRSMIDRIDAHAAALPVEWAHDEGSVAPIALGRGPRTLDLAAAGISTVIWATGYRRAYPWLDVPALDADGEIVQRRGVTNVAGLYTLGLSHQRHRGSHMIGGVGPDAALLARDILAAGAQRRNRARERQRPALFPRLVNVGLT
jgi:putative flavoprotein involved in K+ transport